MTLEFRVLGPVEAEADATPLNLGGPQQKALLAILLLRANQVVHRDRLIDELWGDSPPAAARETIKVYIGRLRKVFGENGSSATLLTRGGGYVLEVDPEQVDVNRFEELAAQGSAALEAGDVRNAASLLRDALSLWRGPALGGVGDVAFAPAEQDRLEEKRLVSLEERIEAELALGRAGAVIPELRQLIRHYPYRERLHRQLMLALYRSGRQADALAAYQQARALLVGELGIEPSTELQQLEHRILTHDSALDGPATEPEAAITAPAKSTGRRRRRLAILASVAVAALAAAAVVLAFVFTRGDSGIDVQPDSVVVLDPTSNELDASIPVGRAPNLVATAGGHVWVGNSRDRTVVDVDRRLGRTRATIPLDAPPVALLARRNEVWAITGTPAPGSALELVRIERFGVIRKTATGTNFGTMPKQPLAVTASGLWTPGSSPATLARRDPATLRVRATIELDATPQAVTGGEGAVWATTASNRLVKIDPVTNDVLEEVPTAGRPLDVTVAGDAVWFVSWRDDTVVRYDFSRSATPIRVGDRPVALAAGFGSVWVVCSGDATVWRIDIQTNEVVGPWNLQASPEDIAAGAGFVWVVVQGEPPP
jgi:DNA-binding SARP family transcriptional activator